MFCKVVTDETYRSRRGVRYRASRTGGESMAEFKPNKKWLAEASKPVTVRKDASQKEIQEAVKKEFKRRGLTK